MIIFTLHSISVLVLLEPHRNGEEKNHQRLKSNLNNLSQTFIDTTLSIT